MTVGVIDRDLGMAKMIKGFRKFKGLELTIGYQGQKAEETHDPKRGGANVAEVATFQEFGTIHIPERSSLRSAIENAAEEIVGMWRQAMLNVIDGGDPMFELEIVGRRATEIVRKRIRTASSWATPLAESTIDKKGHDLPLRETDKMMRAITWAIRKGGQIVRMGT